MSFIFQITSSSGSCAVAQQRKSADFRIESKLDCLDEKGFLTEETLEAHAEYRQLYDNCAAITSKSVGLDWIAEQDSNGSLSLSSADFSPVRETHFGGYKCSNLDFYTDFEYPGYGESATKYAPKQQIFHCL